MPDWVPEIGGKTFGFNISTIGNISIPRLAKGGVVGAEGSLDHIQYGADRGAYCVAL